MLEQKPWLVAAWEAKWPERLIIAAGGLIAAFVSGARLIDGGQSTYAVMVGVAGVLVFLANVSLWIRDARQIRNTASPDALDGVMFTLRTVLREFAGSSAKKRNAHLRACVFVPVVKKGERSRNAKQARRVTRYVGAEGHIGANKVYSTAHGIVGQAIRNGGMAFASLPTDSDLVAFYVSKYGYTEKEARDMRQDRRSWAAVPIVIGDRVVAVIYADANVPEFFGTSSDARSRKALQAVTVGVAHYVQVQDNPGEKA